jgi:hypothetical protein
MLIGYNRVSNNEQNPDQSSFPESTRPLRPAPLEKEKRGAEKERAVLKKLASLCDWFSKHSFNNRGVFKI